MVNNYFLLTFVALLTLSIGCGEIPPGGDPKVNQTMAYEGKALINEISGGPTETSLSFQWIWVDSGEMDDEVHVVMLDDIQDLPQESDLQVGDEIPLQVTIEWKGKMSAGPPGPFDHVDKRTIRYREIPES